MSKFKGYLDNNDSLTRLSLIMNQLPEEDCLEILNSVLEHHNVNIFRMADRVKNAVDLEEAPKKKGKKTRAPNNKG